MRIVEQQDFEPPEPIEGVFTPLSRAQSVPPVWIVENLIAAGLNIFGGPPKALKSTLVMAVSLAISGHKVPALPADFKVIRPGRVAGFSYEATAGELLHMSEHGLDTEVADNGMILIADDPWLFQLDDEDGVSKLLFWLNEIKPKLCFIDPFAESHSLEEKDSRAMIQLLRPLHRWGKENESAIVLVHHLRKRGTDAENTHYTAHDLRGSSAIFGKMDGVLIITPHEDKPGLLTIVATFKRGKGWKRDIQFAAYGENGEALAVATGEVVDDVARMVLGMLKAGIFKHRAISTQLKIGRLRVQTAIDALVRVGLIARVGKKITIMKTKPKGKVKR